MNDNVKDFGEARRELNLVAGRLNHLASSFYATGNEKVSDELYLMADMILSASGNMDAAFGRTISQMVRDAHQATGNMILACLAVGEVRNG